MPSDFISELYSRIEMKTEFPLLFLSAWGIMALTAAAIAFSVAYKFMEYGSKSKEVVKHKKHIVETFSMTVLVVVIFNVLVANFGSFKLDYITALMALIWGALWVFIATWLHIWSKKEIGLFWSNQIEITKGHKIVTRGPYALVRHPMYSSMIIWLLAVSLMFANYIGLALSLIIFTPIMIWRAKSEDKLLQDLDKTSFVTFSEKTNILVPHLGRKLSLIIRIIGIGLLGYSVVLNQMTFERLVFLFIMFITISLTSNLAKVRFSYFNKSLFLFVIYAAALAVPKFYFLYYVILAFNIWGLKFNCPCMAVYEKYNGCPCFRWLKTTCRLKNK
ncbi:MAG: isoprenylcysteine carboxylmethyltransferase family protein [Alphaproteobacteria bacterium]